jgi:hypothetical protein
MFRASSSGHPDLVVLPVFKKNARFLLPFVMIVIAVD